MKWIYDIDENNLTRYSLGQINNDNGKTLLCFGINPSTACPEKLDNTIKKIICIAKYNGYDNWIMLNIYPQRATNPDDIHNKANVEIIKNNLKFINQMLKEYQDSDVLYAYGNLIMKRNFLKRCLDDITALLKKNQKTIKALKITKDGNPYHPLYVNKNTKLIDLV